MDVNLDEMKQEVTMTQPVENRGLNDACNHGKEESSGFPPLKSQGILVPYLWLLLGSFPHEAWNNLPSDLYPWSE